jgi:large subunit ribosomal protein L10
MNRTQKAEVVKDLNKYFTDAKVVILAQFTGMDVNTTNELRKTMREAGVDFRLVKNTLARRAIEGTSCEPLKDEFTGSVALAMHTEDGVAPAKVLDTFIKEHDKGLEVKKGILDGTLLEAAGVKQLASLPGIDESRAKLLSVLLAPASQLVRLLNEPGSAFVRVLSARRESME